MESGRVYSDSNMTVVLQNKRVPCSSEVLDSLWISNSSPSFHGDSGSGSGSTSMVNLENFQGGKTTDGSFFPPLDKGDNGNEDYDDCFHQPGKKRRLTGDQVRFLEKNFEVENKLEPDRKVQLAKELGLQPRQVAIWFQNRRARFKTKQLEKDYDSLKSSYDKLKSDYECLLKEKENLKNEVLLLTEKLLPRDKEKENSEPCEPIEEMDSEPRKPISNEVSENTSKVPMLVYKQEDASSAKSDVFDSDSPFRDANRCSSLLEPADSSHVFGPDHSDFDEEDNVSKSFLQPPCLLKLEDTCYDDPPLNSCFLNFPIEEAPSWLWPY